MSDQAIQKRSEKRKLPESTLFRMVRGDRKYAHQMTKVELFGWYNDSYKMLRALEKSIYSSDKLKKNLVQQINDLMLYFDEAFPGWRNDMGVAEGAQVML